MKALRLIAAFLAFSALRALPARADGVDSPDCIPGPVHTLTYQYDPGTSRDIAPAVPDLVANPSMSVTVDVYDPPTNAVTPPPGGHVGGFVYDGTNRVITSTVPAVQDGTYDFQNRQTLMTDSTTTHPGGTTQTMYDTQGRVTQSVTPPGGSAGVTSYQYDNIGNIISHTAPDSHGIQTHYDDNAFTGTSTMTDPLGHVTTYAYDDSNNLITQIHPDSMGHTTTYMYDTQSRMTSMTDAAGTTMYDTSETNNSTHYDTTTSPGNVTRNQYDAIDRTTTVTDPHSNVTMYQYDSTNRVIRTTDAGALGNTTTVYDMQDRTSSTTDPGGHVTSYQYDSTYNLTNTPVSGGGSMTQSTYDATGSMTDPLGHVTMYTYDATYDLTRTPGPDGFTYQYTYDVSDTITPPNLPAVQYTYDSSGTLTPQAGGTPSMPRFQYDASYDFSDGQSLNQTGNISALLGVSFVPLPSAAGGGLAVFGLIWVQRRWNRRRFLRIS